MQERRIEDRLREEYFKLLPEIRRVQWQLETEINSCILGIKLALKDYERLDVKARIKDCESAITSLRRRQEGNIFIPEKSEEYTLLKLRDLAGVRILAFPQEVFVAIDQRLRQSLLFRTWSADPILYAGKLKAPKYFGYCENIHSEVLGEYQIVPMLIGRFWDVEHSAMYKPTGWAKGADKDPDLRSLRTKVEQALLDFETEFESFVTKNARVSKHKD
jgi:hypothetical protein